MNRISLLVILLLLTVTAGMASADNEKMVEIKVAHQNTLIGLCQKYLEQPQKWKQVAALNRLADPNRLKPGQKLVVPVSLLKGMPKDGQVVFLQGDVAVQPPGSDVWKSLQVRDRVQEGSSLRTSAHSALELEFDDGTSCFLRENSLLTIKKSRQGALHLLRVLRLEAGKIISRVKSATGKDSRFEVETPSALAAARGTHYRVAVDEQLTTTAEMLESRIDVVAMGKTITLKEGEGAITRQNEPPSQPVRLIEPPEALHVAQAFGDMTNNIHFSRIANAANYRVVLAYDRECKHTVKTALIKPDAPFVFEGLADGSYYLSASSIGAEGLEGAASKPQEIIVRRKPLPPDILFPAEKEVLPEMPMTAQWHNVIGAVSYQAQIAKTPDFSGALLESGEIKKTVFSINDLQEGAYYLRVKSLAEGGYAGDWSSVRTFTVAKLAPPSLRKPDVADDKLYVEWESMKGVNAYHLQIARDADFGNILIDRTVQESRLVLDNPPDPGRYYMRVSPQQGGHDVGSFSKAGSFEIEKSKNYYLESLGIAGGVGLALLLVFL